jgi:hypothetical protein
VSHLDPEQLALLALGEPVASESERDHLASCPVCSAEVTEMTHAVSVARSTMDGTELETPSARVWGAIAEELGLSSAVMADPLRERGTQVMTDAASPPPDEPAADSTAFESGAPGEADSEERAAPGGEADAPDSAASRRSRRPHRRTRTIWVLAASVALIVAAGAGLWAGLANLAPTSIATASLDAFPDHPQAVGSAEVDEARDGTRTLTVTLEGAADPDAYREVWLIRNDGAALISLGVLDDETGRFAIPPGVDLGEYDLVDISFEPVDGDPAHSGDSIVRGQLSFA